jgi:cytochrome b561
VLNTPALNESTCPQAQRRYSTLAIVLHWLLAGVIAFTFCLGFYMADLPFSPQRVKLFNWHKWAGITILALSGMRLLWRFTHRPPTFVHVRNWQHWAAQGTHGLLYVLFFAVPLVGWVYSSAAGFPVVLFGWLPLPNWVLPDKALAALIKPWHANLAFALAALVLLHVLAAFKHQFVNKDRLIQRMWFT